MPSDSALDFAEYIALGDSISIDRYPGIDYLQNKYGGRWAERDIPSGLGASSLFYKNSDSLWPEFQGLDLSTLVPAIEFTNLTSDGATTNTLFGRQLPRLEKEEEKPTLITLTIGGNDLLGMLGGLPEDIKDTLESELIPNLRQAITQIEEKRPHLTLLVGNVYDPTDGTFVLEGRKLPPKAADWLGRFNGVIREICEERGHLAVDIHSHFMGHGASQDPEDRWYWRNWIIEPNTRGASEVRRLWLEALGIEFPADSSRKEGGSQT